MGGLSNKFYSSVGNCGITKEMGEQPIVGPFCETTLIRGKPERAPNSGETYGKFAVPMYVCECVCM